MTGLFNKRNGRPEPCEEDRDTFHRTGLFCCLNKPTQNWLSEEGGARLQTWGRVGKTTREAAATI